MNTIPFSSKGKIKMIAHRGLSGIERENTCPAFVAAGVKSYYGIETDVHITKDGKFILCHDSNLKRVAGSDTVIEETDFDALRSIRFSDADSDFIRGDVFLPSLEEYMYICKKHQKEAVLEIKTEFEEKDTSRLIEAVKALGMLDRTTFISFFKSCCLDVKKLCPEAKIQFLSDAGAHEAVQFCIQNGFDADLYYKTVTKQIVDEVHRAGRSINVWTVNDINAAELMMECGVDYITTNILE